MVSAQTTDEELAREAREGQPQAFAALYERYFERVYDFARRIVRDDDEAVDVAQEAFLKAYLAIQRMDAPPASARAWLFSVVHNVAIDRLRRSARGASPTESEAALAQLPASDDPPEALAERRETAALVWRAATALRPQERALLLLHVREGLDAGEIADALGKRRGTVHVMLSRARDAFEDAFASMMLAERGRADCPELAAITAGEALSPALRRRIRRHSEQCEVCSRNRRRFVSPAEILAALAPVPAPPGLRESIARRFGEEPPAAAAGRLGTMAAIAAGLAAIAAIIATVAVFTTRGDEERDTMPPRDPADARSTTHEIGTPSFERVIRVVWSPATDEAPGGAGEIGGYSVEWSNEPDTVPDMVADLPGNATEHESAELADGHWWFHLSTVDAAGNWTRTVHLGRFVIAAEPTPTSIATPEPIDTATPSPTAPAPPPQMTQPIPTATLIPPTTAPPEPTDSPTPWPTWTPTPTPGDDGGGGHGH